MSTDLLVRLKTEQTNAMRAHDKIKLQMIRLVLADIQQTVTSKERRDPTDDDALLAIRRMIKVKKESAESFAKGGRDVSVFEQEISVLENFLPMQMTEDKIREIAEGIILEKKLDKAMKSMGPILKDFRELYAGQYDPAMASSVVKSLLS